LSSARAGAATPASDTANDIADIRERKAFEFFM